MTGGAGFIGSYVAEHLLQSGHEVAVLDDLSTGARGNVPKGALFYEADIRSGCAEIFTDFGPEALCHQAAQMDVRRSVKEPDFDADVNILGTVRLLRSVPNTACGRSSSPPRAEPCTASSRNIPPPRITRSTRLPLRGLQARGRAIPALLPLEFGLPYVALRYANVYGPRQDPHGEAGVVAIFCGNLASGTEPRR